MKEVYQVTICGKKLESNDLRLLLARAVREKRSLDHKFRMAQAIGNDADRRWCCADAVAPAFLLEASSSL